MLTAPSTEFRLRASSTSRFLLSTFFLLLSGSARGQALEERTDLTTLHILCFNQEVALIKQAIVENLAGLKGVERSPGARSVPFQERKIEPAKGKQFSSFHANEEKLDEVSINVTWTPPPVAPQKTSSGGSHLVPRSSGIYIKVMSLKSNPCAVAVSVTREWIYNGLTHVPYTEIPLPRGDASRSGAISADEDWLRTLGHAVAELSRDEVNRDSRLMDILEHLPACKNEPAKPPGNK